MLISSAFNFRGLESIAQRVPIDSPLTLRNGALFPLRVGDCLHSTK